MSYYFDIVGECSCCHRNINELDFYRENVCESHSGRFERGFGLPSMWTCCKSFDQDAHACKKGYHMTFRRHETESTVEEPCSKYLLPLNVLFPEKFPYKGGSVTTNGFPGQKKMQNHSFVKHIASYVSKVLDSTKKKEIYSFQNLVQVHIGNKRRLSGICDN